MPEEPQARNYQVISVTMEKGILSRTRRAARKNGVSVSGLINFALERLLDPKKERSLTRILEQGGLGKRRQSQ